MIGMIVLVSLILAELFFNGFCILKKKSYRKEKAIFNGCELGLFVLLALAGVIQWSFRWGLLAVFLVVRGIMALVSLVRKKPEKNYKLTKVLLKTVVSLFLVMLVLTPALVFPQTTQLKPTGDYDCETVSYTWTDKNRVETFRDDGSNRKVTVQFWYPKTETDETFPLVVFSHGAFGYRMSNLSTFEELASHGYVVCSIDHPYHAFFTKQTDGEIIPANREFIQAVLSANGEGADEAEIFSRSREWLALRCGDMNFVLDTIAEQTQNNREELVYQCIDFTKIGVIGHSMGGAAAVELGRERTDIDAVIDLEGTMFGEETAYENGAYQFRDTPYLLPLLSIDSMAYHEEAEKYGDLYVNNVVLKNAQDALEVHFIGAEHLNFTDLPRFSPILASYLGAGEIDPDYCINTMNGVILEYYNHYLKGDPELLIQETY